MIMPKQHKVLKENTKQYQRIFTKTRPIKTKSKTDSLIKQHDKQMDVYSELLAMQKRK